ncbi:glycine zipper 2TM domain-containing protein [Shewanella insulae]|uniref:glycine zipper 2TM domain-containing protein n=1 Tax=Shewanella insulae TaxID=2681496 RepID=UPI001EFC68CE|nr:glycine zipper 2TM domain-containing protein [Shewanella insulae]MCG9711656.1 glycine zipper 2TM domain-containing protein [Shewanella insulae]MCG9739134.1 glycine zipper 2TM domain-containing protein [Shewanella insulae]
MLKPTARLFRAIWSVFILLASLGLSSIACAAYERNQAVPVEKVEYGHVISVRNITQSQLVEDRNQGWRTFGGALIGGVIGHQFGGGSGQDVATVLGALIGGGLGHSSGGDYYQKLKLVELMIRYEDGQEVMVIQDFDPGMIFNVDDEVRVVYLQGSVRVDLAM